MYLKYSIAIKTRHYYVCCRDGDYRINACKRKTEKQRPSQKSSRKINDVCLSRMYVDEYSDHHVEVMYISAHMNHQLGSAELSHLPLPISTRDEVALKVSKGISTERILEGKS